MSDNKLAGAARRHELPDPPRANALAASELALLRGCGPGSSIFAAAIRSTTSLLGKRHGPSYKFEVRRFDETKPVGGGVYVFVRRYRHPTLLGGEWAVGYVGECKNFATRVGAGHEHWAEAVSWGMTHALYMPRPYSTKQQRLDIETDLRHFYDPPLNRQ